MGPKALIVFVTIIGAVIWKVPGAVGGFVIGLTLALTIGRAVRRFRRSFMPRKVRRSLATNLLSNYPDEVRAAFPSLENEELQAALEDAVENVVRKATVTAPSHGVIWNEGVILNAALELASEQTDQSMFRFYLRVERQIARDWYGEVAPSECQQYM